MRAGFALAALALALSTAVAADEPSAEAVLAELPFLDSAQPNQVIVDLAPEGAALPLALIVDTSAPVSFATAAAARALGIAVSRSRQSPYRRATRLGRDLELQVDTRSSDTGGRTGEHALLGAPFLSHYVLELDFPRARLRFLDPERYRVPEREAGAATLPLRLVSSRPLIDLEIGGARVPAAIATGVPGTLIVPGGWMDEAGLRADPQATAQLVLPPGSPKLEAATAERVRLGPFEETQVPLLVAPNGLRDQGARGEALLGVDFLKRFVLRIDYARKLLWIADRTPKPNQ